MPTPNPVDWNAPSWTDAISRSLAATAKSRIVIPRGIDHIGSNTITVPVIAPARLAYANDVEQSTVHIYVDVDVDDEHVNDNAAVVRLLEAGGATLGSLEDQMIFRG